MSIRGTLIKLSAVALVLLFFTFMIIVVFGQMRFDRTYSYSAIFSNASGLRSGQFVRAGGVEIGKVSQVQVIDAGTRVRIDFDVNRSVSLYQGTTASIRYLNLIGDRYLELKRGENNQVLHPVKGNCKPPSCGTIPIERTEPALDLDALVGSFRPLFRALDANKVNSIAQSLITVFQGEGGTINDILVQTAQFTSTLADRDQAIGEVINNLNTVLGTAVKHQKELDDTINNFEVLVTGLQHQADPLADSVNISNAAGTIADIFADNRPLLHDTLGHLEEIQGPLVDQRDQLNDILVKLPTALKIIGRAGGIYGDFFNFYACDISLKLNGLQPGGPVRTVKVTSQPSGRCTPQ